mgnify:CR=1 FL=1
MKPIDYVRVIRDSAAPSPLVGEGAEHFTCCSRHVLFLILLLGLLPSRMAHAASEYELKAAFLYNFALYTEWPSSPASVRLCVLGRNPFGESLTPLNHKNIRGASVSVSFITTAAEARTCQVLFIAASAHSKMPSIVTGLGDSPVLTVSEANDYDSKTVMVVLATDNNRVSFDISQTVAQQAGLKLSSQLLKLARQVQ